MVKKAAFAAFVLFGVFCFASAFAAAQDAEDAKTRLRELREKRATLTFEYEDRTHELNKATEKKLDKIKTDFRTARDECLKEKNDEAKQLLKDFESKLKPMIKEEEELIGIAGPSEEGNFARSRAEKNRAR